MKILVCISSVPDTTTKITFVDDNKNLNKQGVQFVINPYDEFGLTKAIKLKEQHGGTVTTICVGQADVEPVIRKTLAIGADDAVRIDTAPIDAMHVATEIANYVKDKGFDLIIAGRESIDYNGGLVPHFLGELLNLPSVSPCIEFAAEGGTAKMTTVIDGGKESLSANLPVVIGSQKGLVEETDLIIPNMRGIMMSRSKPLAVVPAGGTEHCQAVQKHELPAPKAGCKMIDSSNVDELVNLLQNEAKVI